MFVRMAPKGKKCAKLCIPLCKSNKDARRRILSTDLPPPLEKGDVKSMPAKHTYVKFYPYDENFKI
jgi:hypothetical protein